jgi:hypothetical protein
MISLPKEIQLKEICQYLNCENIINLSQVNHSFYLINEYDDLWKYLLYRDFGIEYKVINVKKLQIIYKSDDILYRDFENAIINIKNLYMLYKYALEKLTKVHPIITQRTLLKVIEEIPKFEWDNLCMALRETIFIPEQHILSINNLIDAINNTEYKNEFIMPDSYRQKIKFTSGDANLIWDNFNIMIKDIENDRTKYKNLVSKQSFIFVQNHLILCKYDYELAEQFLYELISNAIIYCHEYMYEITEEIFDELRIKLRIDILI